MRTDHFDLCLTEVVCFHFALNK